MTHVRFPLLPEESSRLSRGPYRHRLMELMEEWLPPHNFWPALNGCRDVVFFLFKLDILLLGNKFLSNFSNSFVWFYGRLKILRYWQKKSNNNLRTGVRIWNITHSLFTISDRRGKFKRINIFMRICVQERERAHEQNRLIPLPSLSQNGIKTSEADVHQALLYTSLTRIVEGNGREYISSPPEEGEIKFPSCLSREEQLEEIWIFDGRKSSSSANFDITMETSRVQEILSPDII